MQAGDVDSAARLIGTLAFPAYQHGRIATVERWFGWLEHHADHGKYPGLGVLAAMLPALTGKPADAERRAKIAERGAVVASLPDGSLSIEPWLAVLRALLCRDGVDRMLADAQFAAETMAAGSFWRTASILYLATAHLMAGDPDRADVLFEDAAAEGQAGGTADWACVALGERSLLAIANGAWGSAERLLAEASVVVREANLEDYPPGHHPACRSRADGAAPGRLAAR